MKTNYKWRVFNGCTVSVLQDEENCGDGWGDGSTT